MSDATETKEPTPFFAVPPPRKEDESARERTKSESSTEEPTSPDIEFKPIVSLPLVEVKTLEEDEEELLKIRAKLYRFETAEDPPEWKERGVGEVKLLKHKTNGTVRILMRRDKTLKICANHYITPIMELKKHANSDKAFVWSTHSDFSEDEARPETLCIRFGSPENAQKYQTAFEEAKKLSAANMAYEMSQLNFNDSSDEDYDEEQDTTTEGEGEKVTNEISPEKQTEAKVEGDSKPEIDKEKANGVAQKETNSCGPDEKEV